MAKPRRKGAPLAHGGHTLLSLDDNALVKVLLAAKEDGTLCQWASLSKQLCELARSRVAFPLCVTDQEQAGLVIRSHARGRPPFSGCTELYVDVYDVATCCLAGGVLEAVQHWTALKQLWLHIRDFFIQQQQEEEELGEEQGLAMLEHYASSLLMRVRTHQQLRSFSLDAPALGACSAGLLLQLTQLTSLTLTAPATPAGPPSLTAAAAADLGAMSAMTNLVKLHLNWALAPRLPAGPEGPYCFPSSLVTLALVSKDHTTPVSMAHWVAHLPGCPQLQSLTLEYGGEQHVSAHPTRVARLLARHNRRLHTWAVHAEGVPDWIPDVAALAGAEEMPVGEEWRPDDALAALSGLQSLDGSFLCVRDEVDWQRLAQLTALTKLGGATFHYAPPLQGSVSLSLVQLHNAHHSFGGHALGRLLLACPMLEHAGLVMDAPSAAHVPIAALPSHPRLRSIQLGQCCRWGDAAAAVAQFATLAPVLSSVTALDLRQWPAPSAWGTPALPDLSPCKEVTALQFVCAPFAGNLRAPHQVDFLSMVTPLVLLVDLEVHETPWVTPEVAVPLQYMLPQLQCIMLRRCGRLSGAAPAAGGAGQQQQEEVPGMERDLVLRVEGLLRAGLELHLF